MPTNVTNSMIAFDGGSLGFRNKIINGKMTVALNGTSFNVDQNTQNTLNQWEVTSALGNGKGTVTLVNDVPSDNEFQNSLRFTTTLVQNANTQHIGIAQYIKGYNVRDLIDKSFTLSFWVKSNKPGAYSVSLGNIGDATTSDRSYVASYSIFVANRWEKKTITVREGLITGGTWNWTDGRGLRVLFTLAGTVNSTTSLNQWLAGDFYSSNTQVNILDVGGNNFNITGVQLERGVVATPFEHRPYDIEADLATIGSNTIVTLNNLNTLLATLSTNIMNTVGNYPYLEYAWVTAPNASGQSITANTLTTLILDTEIADTGDFGSISSNQITLAAGVYRYLVTVPMTLANGQNALLGITNASNTFLARRHYATNTPHNWPFVVPNAWSPTTITEYPNGPLIGDLEGQFTINNTTLIKLVFMGSSGGTVGITTSIPFSLATANMDQRTTIKLWKVG